MEPDDLPRPKPKYAVDDLLDTISVNELHQRIAAFEFEIQRLRNEINRKNASRSAADAVFKI